MAWLADAGYHAEVVEQTKRVGTGAAGAMKVWKVDLWNFTDVLAIKRGEVLAVQVTSWTNVASRVRKITDSPLLPLVREAGIRIVVHGWHADGRLRQVDLS
jgi:aryl-alcohol dehydrogenase-like predicted oxidoreductase